MTKTDSLIEKLDAQIAIHQGILDSHSVCPRDFHHGAIKALQDAVKIVERYWQAYVPPQQSEISLLTRSMPKVTQKDVNDWVGYDVNNPPKPVIGEGEMDARDWPEDFKHENGNYQNLCCECGKLFFGHKRRVVCRSCIKEKEALTKTEQPDQLVTPEDVRDFLRDTGSGHSVTNGNGDLLWHTKYPINCTLLVKHLCKQPVREFSSQY